MTVKSGAAQHDVLLSIDRPRPGDPADHVLVVVEYDGAVLLVFNGERRRWELPGGQVDAQEDPAQRAAAELAEETGQRAMALRLCGWAELRRAPDGMVCGGHVYWCEIEALAPFRENGETSAIRLWRGEDADDVDQAAIGIIGWSRGAAAAP